MQQRNYKSMGTAMQSLIVHNQLFIVSPQCPWHGAGLCHRIGSMFRGFLSFFSMLLLAVLPSMALATSISGMAVERGKDVERVIFYSDASLKHSRLMPLTAPDRLAIDFPTLNAQGLALPSNYQGALITRVRVGQFNASTTRIVMDLNAPVRVKGAYAVAPDARERRWRYVLDLQAMGAVKPSPTVASANPEPAQPAPPTKRKPRIVIDAGHGGQDPGAIGTKGTREKDVTLRYARALRQALLRTGKYEVILTRDSDRFIALGARVNIARKAKGDVFISLHADSNPRPEARGFSVYTLSENASDAEAEALAAQENKSDIIGGLDLGVQDEEVASILIDLVQRETMNKSSFLADTVVKHAHPKITRLPNTHRFAGFRVLKAPDIPSILIELGFLTNAQDERVLNSREFEGLLTQSIEQALTHYFEEHPVHAQP
jgi:N-acetylmuramoyl-L-alanine amidase